MQLTEMEDWKLKRKEKEEKGMVLKNKTPRKVILQASSHRNLPFHKEEEYFFEKLSVQYSTTSHAESDFRLALKNSFTTCLSCFICQARNDST